MSKVIKYHVREGNEGLAKLLFDVREFLIKVDSYIPNCDLLKQARAEIRDRLEGILKEDSEVVRKVIGL